MCVTPFVRIGLAWAFEAGFLRPCATDQVPGYARGQRGKHPEHPQLPQAPAHCGKLSFCSCAYMSQCACVERRPLRTAVRGLIAVKLSISMTYSIASRRRGFEARFCLLFSVPEEGNSWIDGF
jgi:hypothetical protein